MYKGEGRRREDYLQRVTRMRTRERVYAVNVQ